MLDPVTVECEIGEATFKASGNPTFVLVLFERWHTWLMTQTQESDANDLPELAVLTPAAKVGSC